MQISWTHTFILILKQKTENDKGKHKFDTETASSFRAVACMHEKVHASVHACTLRFHVANVKEIHVHLEGEERN